MKESDRELGFNNETRESPTFTRPLREALGRVADALQTFYSDERGQYYPPGAGMILAPVFLGGLFLGVVTGEFVSNSTGFDVNTAMFAGGLVGAIAGFGTGGYIETHLFFPRKK